MTLTTLRTRIQRLELARSPAAENESTQPFRDWVGAVEQQHTIRRETAVVAREQDAARLQALRVRFGEDTEPLWLAEELRLTQAILERHVANHGDTATTRRWLDAVTKLKGVQADLARQSQETVSLKEVEAAFATLYESMLAVVRRHALDPERVQEVERGWQRLQLRPERRKGEMTLTLVEERR